MYVVSEVGVTVIVLSWVSSASLYEPAVEVTSKLEESVHAKLTAAVIPLTLQVRVSSVPDVISLWLTVISEI